MASLPEWLPKLAGLWQRNGKDAALGRLIVDLLDQPGWTETIFSKSHVTGVSISRKWKIVMINNEPAQLSSYWVRKVMKAVDASDRRERINRSEAAKADFATSVMRFAEEQRDKVVEIETRRRA